MSVVSVAYSAEPPSTEHCSERIRDLAEVLREFKPETLSLRRRWKLLSEAHITDINDLTTLNELRLIDVGTLKAISPEEANRLRAAREATVGSGFEVSLQSRDILLNNKKRAKIDVIGDHTALVTFDKRVYQAYWDSEGPTGRAFFRIGETEIHMSPVAAILKSRVAERDLKLTSRLAEHGWIDPMSVRALTADEVAPPLSGRQLLFRSFEGNLIRVDFLKEENSLLISTGKSRYQARWAPSAPIHQILAEWKPYAFADLDGTFGNGKSPLLPSVAKLYPERRQAVREMTDGQIEVVSLEPGRPQVFQVTQLHHRRREFHTVTGIIPSPDGREILEFNDEVLTLIDRASGKIVSSFRTPYIPSSMEFSPDGTKILVTHGSQGTFIYEKNTGKVTKVLNQYAVSFAHYSPDGTTIATFSKKDRGILIRNLDGVRLKYFPLSKDESLTSARFSPDGKKLLAVTSSNQIRMIDLETGTNTDVLPRSNRWQRASFSPDGTKVVVTDHGHEIWVKDLMTNTVSKLRPDIYAALTEFSADGTQLIVSDGTSFKVWNLAGDETQLYSNGSGATSPSVWTGNRSSSDPVLEADLRRFMRDRENPIPDSQTFRELEEYLDQEKATQ